MVPVLLLGTLLLSAGPVHAAATDEEQPAANPVDIAVPYLDEVEVGTAEGWAISDCAAVTVPEPLTVACEPGSFTIATETYDRDFGTVEVPVPIASGDLAMTVVYRVSMAPPTPPTVSLTDDDRPIPAGSRALIPYSDLGIECEGCTDGGPSVRVGAVSPRGAGTASVTPTHLVFAPRPSFVGKAKLRLTLTDDTGQAGERSELTVHVSPAGATTLVALHTAVELAASGPTTVGLAALSQSSGKTPPRLLSCGEAVHGTVTCAADGTATYTPVGAPQLDQFSFRTLSDEGEQATGSITLVPAGTGTVPLGLIQTTGGSTADSVLAPPPTEDDEDAATAAGVFRPLLDILNG
jgi:hypothetical protein